MFEVIEGGKKPVQNSFQELAALKKERERIADELQVETQFLRLVDMAIEAKMRGETQFAVPPELAHLSVAFETIIAELSRNS